MEFGHSNGVYLGLGAKTGDHMHLHGLLLKFDALRRSLESQEIGRHGKTQRMLHMA